MSFKMFWFSHQVSQAFKEHLKYIYLKWLNKVNFEVILKLRGNIATLCIRTSYFTTPQTHHFVFCKNDTIWSCSFQCGPAQLSSTTDRNKHYLQSPFLAHLPLLILCLSFISENISQCPSASWPLASYLNMLSEGMWNMGSKAFLSFHFHERSPLKISTFLHSISSR